MNTNCLYENDHFYKENKILSLKELENILKNLKQYEARIKEIEIQIEEYKDMHSLCLKGISYENIIRTHQIVSKTEMQVLENLELQHQIELLEFEKRHLDRFIKRIHNAIDSLSDLEKEIIQKKYLENKIWRYITYESRGKTMQRNQEQNLAQDSKHTEDGQLVKSGLSVECE
jgi:predicted KAP-like P-loop ATPase